MEQKTVQIETEFIKLDSLLKFSGVVPTGGLAKELILQGKILYNGEVCTQRGKKVRPGDCVQAQGVEIQVEAA